MLVEGKMMMKDIVPDWPRGLLCPKLRVRLARAMASVAHVGDVD